MRIDPVQGPVPGPAAAAGGRPSSASGFDALLQGPAPAPAAPPPTAAASLATAAPALVEAEVPAVRDRAARRHGRAMLEALAGLQLALLDGEIGDARASLASLAAAPPQAEDPVLRLILREISIRAAVELARPEPAATPQAA